ncbi:hypothetical protein LCIT_01310 [Leuconostoc citreum]|uniref:Uncharacterized protein n=1 Tax=Leuconostoc citreum TaxID=33964 RepID=A0A5A5TXY2_LEUCI|nr:hypothetical protein [Leuconostoc citreum]GDZ82889.1 hypothetical protein LCIT_01310 [Leuconostoc citreum]
MKNKICFSILGLLLIGLTVVLSITGSKREQISEIRKETAKVMTAHKQTTQDVSKIESIYNIDDVTAKTQLLTFAKAYYTFSSQADYLQRFDKLSGILALSDKQKNSLFDNGLDDTGGSRIDNLGLQSTYDTATGYTSDVKDNMIEVLATVVVKTSGSNQQSVKQVIVLHAFYDLKQQKLVSIKINPVQE